MKNNFFLVLIVSILLSGCAGVASKGLFGTGVSVAFDPRSVGTQTEIVENSWFRKKDVLVKLKYKNNDCHLMMSYIFK